MFRNEFEMNFKTGSLILFNLDETADLSEWQEGIRKILSSGNLKGETLLRQLADNNNDLSRRSTVAVLLSEAGKLHKKFS